MEQHRLKVLADAFGFSVSQFEREVGVGVSTFSKAIQRNSAINKGIVLMIKDKYPDVNGDWLLTGEGSMFLTTADKIKALAQETGKPHGDDKDVRGLTDYLLAEKLKSMQDMIDEMRQWKKEIEDKLDEKDKKK